LLYLTHFDFTFSAGILHIARHQMHTMKHGQNLRKLFFEGMKPIMASYGFDKGGFHREAFYKTGKGGNYEFALIMPFRGYSSWGISPILGVRSHLVQTIYNAYVLDTERARKMQRNRPTLNISMQNHVGQYGYGEKDIDDPSQLADRIAYYQTIFEKDALPFFHSLPDIASMERLVNGPILLPYKGVAFLDNRYTFVGDQGHVGMILAKLVDSPDYTALAEKYRAYYIFLEEDRRLKLYERLLKRLAGDEFPELLAKLDKKYGRVIVPE